MCVCCVLCVILKFNNGRGRERRQSSILHFRLNTHISNSALCLLLKNIVGDDDTGTVSCYRDPGIRSDLYWKEDVKLKEDAFQESIFKGLQNSHSHFVKSDLVNINWVYFHDTFW